MEIRVLNDNEYDKLLTTPQGELFTPGNSVIMVGIEDDKIRGRMSLLLLNHLEGTWINEAYRSSSLLKRLEDATMIKAKELGMNFVHAYAPDEQVENLLQRLGWTRLPLSVWTKEL